MTRNLLIAALLLAAPSAGQAGVIVRVPFVHVEVGNGVVVRAPFVTVVVPPRYPVVMPGPRPTPLPPPRVVPPPPDSERLPPPRPGVPDDDGPPPVPDADRLPPPKPVPPVGPKPVLPPDSGEVVAVGVARGARAIKPSDFVAGYKPFRPGKYDVIFLHPYSGKPVKVAWDLPVSPRSVVVNKNRITFRWGLLRHVTIRFLDDGRVEVNG